MYSPYSCVVGHLVSGAWNCIIQPIFLDKAISGSEKFNLTTFEDKELDGFLEAEEIRTDIKLISGPGYVSTGCNLLSFIPAQIMTLQIEDKEADRFVMKHELSHIKNNDQVFMHLIGLTTCVAIAILSTRLTSKKIISFPLTLIIPSIAQILYMRYREAKADDFAISQATDEELKGAFRFFSATNNATQDHKFALDISHPSILSRLEKVNKVLEAKGISYSPDDTQEDFDKWSHMCDKIVEGQEEGSAIKNLQRLFSKLKERLRKKD